MSSSKECSKDSTMPKPWKLSPRKGKQRVAGSPPLDNSTNRKPSTELEPSPTRVLDYDAEFDRQQDDAKPEAAPSRPAMTPPASNNSEIFRPGLPAASNSRRSRQYFTALPTLDETSSSETGGDSFDEEENSDDDVLAELPKVSSPKRSSPKREKDLGSPLVQTESIEKQLQRKMNAGARKPQRTAQERVDDYQERADNLAGCGEEEGALTLYKKALKITRNETARIKSQLKQVEGKHPSTVQSIHSRLHEDWLNIGYSIADIRQKMAILSERMGDYDRALSDLDEAAGVFKRQLKFMEKSKVKHDIEDVRNKADALKALKSKMKLAQDSFEKRKMLHEEVMFLRRAAQVAINATEKANLQKQLAEKLALALKVESDILGIRHPQVADTLSLMSSMAWEQGNMSKALEHMKEALSISKEVLGMKHPLTGEMFLQMARLYASQVPIDETRALDYYEKAVEVFRESERNPRLVGTTLNEIAVIRIRQREHRAAIVLLEEALESFASDLIERKEGEINTDTVQIWRNLGECNSFLKDFDKAAVAFVKALDQQREARKVYDEAMEEFLDENAPPPVYLVDDDSIADTLRRLGRTYMSCNKPDDALKVYGEALLIHRSAVVKAVNSTFGRPNEALPERQDQLAHTLFCIAEVREARGEHDEALRIYGESMQLRLFSDAHRQDKRQNMVHCAMCLRGIGNIHMAKEEYGAAQKVFEDAVSYCEGHGLAKDHPIVLRIKQREAEAKKLLKPEEEAPVPSRKSKEVLQLEAQAMVEIRDRKLDAAVETLTKLMAVHKTTLKKLKGEKQDSSDAKHDTAHTLKLFGQVLMAKGDKSNAERAFNDALKLFKKGGAQRDEEAAEQVKKLVKQLQSS